MPPKKAAKRKASDDDIAGRNAATAKRVALENEKFVTRRESPYEARIGIRNLFTSVVENDASHQDSDESDSSASDLDDFEIDDGYEKAMKVEEEYERSVEKAHRYLAIKFNREEEIQAGDVRGQWDLYSPNLLDLRESEHRGEIHHHFHQWKTGSLVIGDHTNNTVLSPTDVTASLSLTGFENDWHVSLDVPKLASLDLVPLTGVRKNYTGSGNAEARLGISFLGNGYLKMRIPGIYNRGKKQWRRHITLYGVNRTFPPREEESPEPLPREETLPRIGLVQPAPVDEESNQPVAGPSGEVLSQDEQLLRRRLLEDLDDSLFVDWPDEN
ncbi:hypothetical protein GT037_000050 [Alternaria burnsii]|uniref:Uncharacterized protein n=1 Tax=Alternaria burnsii TaxID=1187904 RepID=A0A8H7BCL1_9PLEO|nr:uncharacterized protein GT037_000050 [Alternaria burnsii]KAF7681074.1 hypothetical protein GT037_000050 [Alternaria burnsii]